jgi:20S proteasome alpha/beta subunit
MTVIAGIRTDESVYLYADASASDGDTILSMTTPKIWAASDNIICGYAGSAGLGQILQFMKWPALDDEDVLRWMRATLAPAFMEAREKMAGKDEEEASILIGIKTKDTHLFEMQTSDYSFFPFEYSAIGTGSPIALGSLYATKHMDIHQRGLLSIEAAIEHSPSCKGPVSWISC